MNFCYLNSEFLLYFVLFHILLFLLYFIECVCLSVCVYFSRLVGKQVLIIDKIHLFPNKHVDGS